MERRFNPGIIKPAMLYTLPLHRQNPSQAVRHQCQLRVSARPLVLFQLMNRLQWRLSPVALCLNRGL